jgi:hypothetical protein
MRTVEDQLNSARADVQRSVAQLPGRTADDVRRRHRHRKTTALIASGVVAVAVIAGTNMLLPADTQEMAGSTPTPSPPATSDLTPEEERVVERERVIDALVGDDNEHDLEPITGYGDFSNVEYWYVDWYEVTRLEIQCLHDHGFPVEVIPPGDGISFSNVPSEQMEAADRTFEACQAGLNLPEYAEPTHEQLEQHYYYLLELKECVEAEGYATTDPPSLETFIETGGLWSPYDLVANDLQMGIQEWYALNEACPQNPRNP